MRVSVLSVGTEILLGQIANTNAQFISKIFNALGMNVLRHVAVGDNPTRLAQSFEQELKLSDIIILTGGLGPTKDDLTKQTIAEVLGKSLKTDKEAMESIEQYFNNENRTMTENNKQQALVIEDSEILKNDFGMAPGMYIEDKDKIIVLLPGPPKELQPMVKKYLVPFFLNELNVIHSESLKFTGIGESKLETECIDLIENQKNPTIAPLAGQHEVSLRITANANSESEATKLIAPIKQEILNRIGKYYYGSDDTSLVDALFQHLNETFVIYDDVTDGVILSHLKVNRKSDDLLKGYIVGDKKMLNMLNINGDVDHISETLKNMYKAKIAIVLTKQDDEVVIYIATRQNVKKINSRYSQSYEGKRDRVSNLVMIELLNLLRDEKTNS